jgi:hypothetical protein
MALESTVKPFFTYILRCADGSYYTGSTDELEKRIAEHQHGEGCTWTRKRLPVEFVWRQEFASREEAEVVALRAVPFETPASGLLRNTALNRPGVKKSLNEPVHASCDEDSPKSWGIDESCPLEEFDRKRTCRQRGMLVKI